MAIARPIVTASTLVRAAVRRLALVRSSVMIHAKREMFANGIETTGKNVVDTWSGGVLGNGRRLLTLDADIARVVLIAGVVGRVALRRRGREYVFVHRSLHDGFLVHEHVPSPPVNAALLFVERRR